MGAEVDLPPLLAGRYRPIKPLGVGGMGAVYVVEHAHTGERLALKVLLTQARASRDALERFKREARALALVRSEHVVRVTDADVAPELDNAPFLVMELLEGTDLERATRNKPQPPAVVINWLRQVSQGLERAHAADITHRDLKPENLFLAKHEDGSDLIKILDFGIAKVRADGAGGRTQTGQIVGTPKFMSPEQARGETDAVGPAADIWAIGLIAFRLLMGTDYWTAVAVTLLLAQIIYEPIVPPSARGCSLGSGFDRWFLRSCDRDPALRWASVREQVDALAEALSGESAQTLHPTVPAQTGDERPPTLLAPSSDLTPAPPNAPTFTSASISGSTASPPRRPGRLVAVLGLGATATALVAAGVAIGAKASRPTANGNGIALVDNAVTAPSTPAPEATVSATTSTSPTTSTSSPAVFPIPAPSASGNDASPGRPAPRPAQVGGKRPPVPTPPPAPSASPRPTSSTPAPPPPAPKPPPSPRDPLEDQH